MTVGQLIERLQQLDASKTVYMDDPDGLVTEVSNVVLIESFSRPEYDNHVILLPKE